mmetsp:Transcript_13495/g.31555  ORF Transcript_13495/g.31555 Transcript_13495/m.31555 type:complete len:222 (-) Transcript_13495:82-747(-)
MEGTHRDQRRKQQAQQQSQIRLRRMDLVPRHESPLAADASRPGGGPGISQRKRRRQELGLGLRSGAAGSSHGGGGGGTDQRTPPDQCQRRNPGGIPDQLLRHHRRGPPHGGGGDPRGDRAEARPGCVPRRGNTDRPATTEPEGGRIVAGGALVVHVAPGTADRRTVHPDGGKTQRKGGSESGLFYRRRFHGRKDTGTCFEGGGSQEHTHWSSSRPLLKTAI